MIFLRLALDTFSYYLDFVKDWIIFAVLYKNIDKLIKKKDSVARK